MAKDKIENEHVAAILCYFLVGIIWYFADEKMKKSSLVKFHTKQALNLWIISILGNVILSMLIVVGWVLLPIFGVAVFILWILGLINAINSKEQLIPIVGQFAEKYLKF